MTYLPGIPLGTDNLSTSQGDLKTNFGQLEIVFDEDHYTWDDPTAGGDYRGQHRQVNLPQTYTDTSTPVPTLTGNAGAFFTQTGNTDVLDRAEPFFANNSGMADSATQVLWYGGLASLAGTGEVQLSAANTGYLQLPNGLFIQWGRGTFGNGGLTNTFPIAFPTACFIVLVSPMAVGTYFGVGAANFSETNFQAYSLTDSGANPRNMCYIAIGN